MQQLRKRTIGDIEVSYAQSGAGEPVVCVHGLAEDHTSFSGFQQQATGVETFAYDLRGHGGTTLGNAEGTLTQLSDDLIGFLTSVTGPARCIGYSLGGTVVLRSAADHPELIKHAIVIGTSTVVGRSATTFFQERIAMLLSDPEAFAATLTDDTQAQVVTKGYDLTAVSAQRRTAVGDGGGYINAAPRHD